MEINRNAPATAEGELRIDGPADGVLGHLGARPLAVLESRRQVGTRRGPGPAGHGVPQEGPTELPHLTLQVADPPGEITWTRTTMGIKAVHIIARFGPQAAMMLDA
jgi:hypothetical protein